MLLDTLIPPKILIVDDDQILTSSLKISLEAEGFEVVLNSNPDTIINTLKQTHFSLAFVDLMMPNKLGFKILKDIKNDIHTRTLPVIIVTNLGHMDYINAGLSMGASDYILKSQTTSEDLVKLSKKYLLSFNARQNLSMQ